MNFDYFVIAAYLLLILGVGVWRSRAVKSLEDFSTGNRSYGSAIVFATLSASFIGGGFTMGLAEKVFSMGLVYVVALWGFSLKEILVATIVAPRMAPFKNAISVGDIMGQLYGTRAKLFTGIASTLICAGIAGAQFAAFGYVMKVLLGIDSFYSIVIGASIVIIYSTLGGMKSVVTNDVIHFSVLIVALPTVLVLGVSHAGGFSEVLQQVPPLHTAPFGALSGLSVFGLFLNFFFGETLVPPYVQRLLIGRTFKETARGTLWSGLLSIPFFFLVGIIGLTALTLNPQLDPTLALPFVINTVMPIGLKGLAIAGMIAVVMSSADSFLNAAAVSCTHDVLKTLRRRTISSKSELFFSRATTVIVGALGALFAISTKSALDILLLAYNFWTPFILVPLVAGIFGLRASASAFWYSAAAGIGSTCIWLYTMGETTLNGAIIGISVNLVVFAAFHFSTMRSPASLQRY